MSSKIETTENNNMKITLSIKNQDDKIIELTDNQEINEQKLDMLNHFLYICCENGLLEVLKILLERKESQTITQDKDKYLYFLKTACFFDKNGIINYLLDKRTISVNDIFGMAYDHSYTIIIKNMFDKGLVLNNDLLKIICNNDRGIIIEFLIEKGLIKNHLNSIINYSCEYDNLIVVELLIKNELLEYIFRTAIKYNSTKIISYVLDSTDRMGKLKNIECFPQIAFENNNFDVIIRLIKSCMIEQLQIIYIIFCAMENNKLNLIELLFKENLHTRLILDISVKNNFPDAILLLLNNGLKTDDINYSIKISCENKKDNIVELLIKYVMNNIKDFDVKSVLNSACEYGNLELVKKLSFNGELEIDDFKYASLIALKNNNFEIVKFMIEMRLIIDVEFDIGFIMISAIQNNKQGLITYLVTKFDCQKYLQFAVAGGNYDIIKIFRNKK